MVPDSPASQVAALEPPRDCPLCPRLVAYRRALREEQPDWWNAPVPVSGDADAWLAIVGLAPGVKGANRTGQAFVGDDSGILLYETLVRHGLAEDEGCEGPYGRLRPAGAAIVNAVRCVPPRNRPNAQEIAACSLYLEPALARLAQVSVVVALGRIAHDAVLRSAGLRLAGHPFRHLAEHRLPAGRVLVDSYHCSRYNQNTGRLTPAMLDQVFARVHALRNAKIG